MLITFDVMEHENAAIAERKVFDGAFQNYTVDRARQILVCGSNFLRLAILSVGLQSLFERNLTESWGWRRQTVSFTAFAAITSQLRLSRPRLRSGPSSPASCCGRRSAGRQSSTHPRASRPKAWQANLPPTFPPLHITPGSMPDAASKFKRNSKKAGSR